MGIYRSPNVRIAEKTKEIVHGKEEKRKKRML